MSPLFPVLLALLSFAGPSVAQEGEASRAPELPLGLRRVPTELPRAESGRWAALFGEPEAAAAAIAALSDEVRVLMGVAEADYRRQDYPATVTTLFDALERAPDLPPALTLLGTTYFRLQRYGDTVTCFERFLEVAPSELWRTQALGHAYYSLGRFERALEHYRRVVATGRAGIDALRGRGLAELKLGREDEGIATLEAVLAQDPEHGEAHEALARVRLERGESELALPLAERARDLDPFAPGAWFLLTRIYFELGREEDAERAETRWREVDRLAQVLRRLEAEEELHPDDLEVTRGIVAARLELGDLQGASRAALRSLQRARSASPDLLELATDVADALAGRSAFEWSDRWAERIIAAFADERATWSWAVTYWEARRDRVRQLAAQRRLDTFDSDER